LIRVETRPNESLERALRRFKKSCEKEGLTKDIKKNAFYEKPSERKRRKYRNSFKKALKEQAKISKFETPMRKVLDKR
jgi:small subunit ribosomal protein S21